MKIGIIVPTLNAEKEFLLFLPPLISTKGLSHVLIIDSSSNDRTQELALAAGFQVQIVSRKNFDHGGTRQAAVELLPDCDILVFITQDAILSGPESIKTLVEAFGNPEVAIAYGRQLPRPGAGPIEAHARLFNYPAISRLKSSDLIPELGLRTAVVSNSFAAYRRSILMELGGFPSGTLFGEDTLTGAKTILAGYKIAYVADATVFHSHRYSLFQEFRRYFDNGVFYSREKWILESFGKAEGSGKAYVLSEIRHLLKTAPWLLPLSVVTVFVKLFGYKSGTFERFLPASLKLRLSMNKAFWLREMSRKAH